MHERLFLREKRKRLNGGPKINAAARRARTLLYACEALECCCRITRRYSRGYILWFWVYVNSGMIERGGKNNESGGFWWRMESPEWPGFPG